jgi:hypothetical protein
VGDEAIHAGRQASGGRSGGLVVDPPARPHLWGVTGDLVVTVDGDLGPAELRRVGGSFGPRSG